MSVDFYPDIDEVNEDVRKKVLSSIESMYPVRGDVRTLEMSNLRVVKSPDPRDYATMKKRRIREQSFTSDVRADFLVRDTTTGRPILKMPNTPVMRLPVFTPNLGFIVRGTEYQINNLPRLKSGAYPRVMRTGDLEVAFNLTEGKNFSLLFDPQTKQFSLKFIGSARKVPLIPVLDALRTTESKKDEVLGSSIAAAGKKPPGRAMRSFYTAVTEKDPADMSLHDLRQFARDTFAETRIRPDTTKVVFGKWYTTVDKSLLLDAAKRMLDINRGKAEPVNRDLPMFKEYYRPADLLADRLNRSRSAVQRRTKFLLDRPERFINEADLAPYELLNGPIEAFFTMSQSSQVSNQYNPLSNINGFYRTSPLGEGGLSSLHVVTPEVRKVHRSGHGIIDPIQTPEGSSVGVSSFLATGFSSTGLEPTTRLYNARTGKIEKVRPAKIMEANIAFSDQYMKDENGRYVPVGDEVEAFGKNGDLYKVPSKAIDYVIPDQHSMYSTAMNAVPFVSADHAVRGGMIYRHMDQALPLRDREQPLVQVMKGDTPSSVEEELGKFSAIRSPYAGTVTRVGQDRISIKTATGVKQVSLPLNYPTNDHKSFISSAPAVSVGDKVSKGQLLADTNFTKDGVLSIGTNLRTGFVVVPGMNFEDGIVISETAAKKLTSEHLYKKSVETGQDNVVDMHKFIQYVPTEKGKLALLDSEGVIKIGSVVGKGDVMVAALNKREFSDGLMQLAKLRSSFKKGMEWKDGALRWESEYPGTVVDVVKRRGGYNIYVRTEEPAEIGDKLSSRHANKGIITTILPDEEMPHNKDGEPVHVAVNPLSVPGRMTDGQLGELAAAKAAEQDGDIVLVRNYDPHRKFLYFKSKKEVPVKEHTRKLKTDEGVKEITVKAHKRTVMVSAKAALDERGLSEEEELFVTRTDDEGNPVEERAGRAMVGPIYTLKLTHQVQKKHTARGVGPNYDASGAPLGGGATGAQSLGGLGIYAMLAHGSTKNLHEMATVKADASQRDYWYALQQGEPLPKPEVPFAYNKFISYLEGLGLDVNRDGTTLSLVPITDKDILRKSNGEIDPSKTLAGHQYKPERGGIFDPNVTGGMSGTKWSHFFLAEPMPNPLFEDAIRTLTGLTKGQFDSIMGKATGPSSSQQPTAGVDRDGDLVSAEQGATGGEGIHRLISRINADQELAQAERAIESASGTEMDKLNKKIHILRTLKMAGLTPDIYMQRMIPVIPPVFRPVVKLPTGSLAVDDLNQIYRYIGEVNGAIKKYPPGASGDVLNTLRAHQYDLMKALAGTGGTVYDSAKDQPQGILKKISGPSPKLGFFQSTLMKRKQDMTAASTIIPGPTMGIDEVGIPRDMLYKVYEPLLIRQMALTNIHYGEAKRHLEERTPTAEKILGRVISEYPLMLKRDPALHMHNILGFRPIPVDGRAIHLHPLVTSGYNADFDGDSCIGDIIYIELSDRSGYSDVLSTKGKDTTMPHAGKVATKRIVNLEMFPRESSSMRIEGNKVIYRVPPNILVPTFNDGRFSLASVSEYSVHQDCEEWETTTLLGRVLTTSQDHSLALLSPETLEVEKHTPHNSKGLCIPTMRSLKLTEETYPVIAGEEARRYNANVMVDEVELTEDVCWALGVFVGDGWVSHNKAGSPCTVHVAHGTTGKRVVADRWVSIVGRLTEGKLTPQDNPHDFDGHDCFSTKYTISASAFARWINKLVPTGAHKKHLPEGFFEWPESCRRALFCGLIDTDGSSDWNRRGKYHLTYNTSSGRLSEEVILLGLSLGLPASRTPDRRKESHWCVHFSIRPVQDATWLQFTHPEKQKSLQELQGNAPSEHGRNDIVPLTTEAADEMLSTLRAMGASKRPPHRNKRAFSLYVVIKRLGPKGYITRTSARHLNAFLPEDNRSPYLEKWFRIALDETVGWDVVISSEPTGETKTMYDLTVPGAWTFVMANGAVVWDTMRIYVPSSKETAKEVRGMFPSKVLFNRGSDKAMFNPTMDATIGLFLLSRVGRGRTVSAKSKEEILGAYDKGVLDPTQPVRVANMTTTGGRVLLQSILGEDILTDSEIGGHKFELTARVLNQKLDQLAKTRPKDYPEASNALKDIGWHFAQKFGLSFNISEFMEAAAVRDNILDRYEARVNRAAMMPEKRQQQELQAIMAEADKDLRAAAAQLAQLGNRPALMTSSGGKPRWTQFKQFMLSPVLSTDSDGKLAPHLIRTSYADGMSQGAHTVAAFPARGSMVEKSISVAGPGYLSKQTIAPMMDMKIREPDCRVNDGETMLATNSEVLNRYLASEIQAGGRTFKVGTLVTPEIMSFLGNKQIKVRSPLHCKTPKGVCQKCYGDWPDGPPETGTNIGVISAQSLGERGTQLALRSFHTGGVGRAGITSSFDRVEQLLRMPKNLPNKAVLSKVDGKVESIREDVETGARIMTISGKEHFIPPRRKIRFNRGSTVVAGQALTDGPKHPQDLLEISGMPAVRDYLTNELYDIYRDEGIKRRVVETVVRGITDLGIVRNPGSHKDLVRGDKISLRVIEDWNKGRPKHEQVEVEPRLVGVGRLGLDTTTDWMARLGFEHLRETIVDAARRGWKADLSGDHPIPRLAYGADPTRTQL